MKKSFYKLIYVSFVFLFLICAVGFINNEVVAAASWTSQTQAPSETDKDGYTLIKNERQLAYLINSISASGKYRLAKNLDMSGYTWPGIQKTFSGTFDGAGYVIENITSETKASQGLFSSVSGAKIQNLSLDNCSFKGYSSVGAIAGSATGATVIEKIVLTDCKVEVVYNTADCWPNVGGAVGYADGTTKIQNVFNVYVTTGYVKSGVSNTNVRDIYMGGIVGLTQSNVTVQNCLNQVPVTNTGKVKASNSLFTGGIVGWAYGKISGCGNTGNISSGNTSIASAYAGGIVGNSTTTISDCFNRGNVTATAPESSSSSTTNINKSMSHATLSIPSYTTTTKTTPAYAGGIAGSCSSSVSKAYNTGSISGGRKRISVSTTASTQQTSSSGGNGGHYSSGGSISTIIDKIFYYASFAYDSEIYTSEINGKTSQSSSYCFGTTSHLKNNVEHSVSQQTYKHTSTTTYTHTSVGGTTTSESYGANTSKRSNSSQKYDYSASTSLSTPYGSKSYSGTRYYFYINSSSMYLKFYNSASWTTGALWWKEDHSATEEISVYSASISGRTQNYTISSNLKTLQSGFSSSVWKVDSSVNDGYPYVIAMYW